MSKSRIKIVYLTGYLLLSLVACSNEEPRGNGGGQGQPLEIGASISDPVVSRASLGAANYEKSSFFENDVIKIGTSANAINTSYTYKKDSSGTLRWLPTAGGDGLTSSGSGNYYASYNPDNYTKILEDQSITGNYQKSNRLITDATAVSGNKVNFSFYPAASKITIIIEYSDDKHVGVTVKLTGDNWLEASSSANVTLLPVTSTGKTHMYVAIVNPGEKKDYQIEVTSKAEAGSSDGVKTYTSLISTTFLAGHNYIYNFTSTYGLILNGITVEGFQSGTGNGTDDNWSAS